MKLTRRIDLLLIGLFGFVGANTRYFIKNQFESPAMGIFLINMIGCLVTGMVSASNLKRELKVVIGFGLIGAFTTYSGIFNLADGMNFRTGYAYVLMQIIIALPMIFLGRFITKRRKSS